MTPELTGALKSHTQSFGSYTRAGELKSVVVWLTVNDGRIEFLTDGQSLKVKRVRRNPRVVCAIGGSSGPVLNGTAEVVTDRGALTRTYHAYWKTHRIRMVLLALMFKRRIRNGRQVLIRVTPDDPNPLFGLTDPSVINPI